MDSKPVHFIVSFIIVSVITLIVGVAFFGDDIFRQGSSRYIVMLFGLFGSASVALAKPFGKIMALIVLALLSAFWILFMPEEVQIISLLFSVIYSVVFGISLFLYLYLPEKTIILRRTGSLLLGIIFSLLTAAVTLLYLVLFMDSAYLLPALILYSSSAFIIGLGIGLGKLLSDYIIGSFTSVMKELK